MRGDPFAPKIDVRPVAPSDADWIREFLGAHWASTAIVSRGRVHHADRLPGFIAYAGDRLLGLATYHVTGDQCELVTLNSLVERIGVGGMLIEAVRDAAGMAGCRRLWLITTNDNIPVIEFYKRRGFTLDAVHSGAIDEARRLKPEIPEVGIGGVPIRDEIEFGMKV